MNKSIISRIMHGLNRRASQAIKTKKLYLGREEYKEYCNEYQSLYDYGEFRVYCGDRVANFFEGVEIRQSKKQNLFKFTKQ